MRLSQSSRQTVKIILKEFPCRSAVHELMRLGAGPDGRNNHVKGYGWRPSWFDLAHHDPEFTEGSRHWPISLGVKAPSTEEM